jgi:hypothetical protein
MHSHAFFTFYWIMLVLSGAALVVVGGAVRGRSNGLRIVNILIGLAFLGYGLYLGFIFKGGSYTIWFYAFALPIILIVRTVQEANQRKQSAAGRPAAPMMAGPQPQPWQQPGQPQAWPQQPAQQQGWPQAAAQQQGWPQAATQQPGSGQPAQAAQPQAWQQSVPPGVVAPPAPPTPPTA